MRRESQRRAEMRKRKNLLFAGTLLVLGVFLGWFGKGFAAGDPALPGSEQDPLVSRSYVDAKMQMVVVEVPAGKRLIGVAGTEIIVRSGSATAIDTLLGGLSDVTEGKDLKNGDAAPANHLLIVPRDDGRGIAASTPLFVMVRGSYSIQ